MHVAVGWGGGAAVRARQHVRTHPRPRLDCLRTARHQCTLLWRGPAPVDPPVAPPVGQCAHPSRRLTAPRPDSRVSAQRLRDGPARPGAGPRPRRHGSNQSCLSAASHTLDGCRGTHLALSSSTLSPALPCRGEVPVSFHNGTLQKSLAAFPLSGRAPCPTGPTARPAGAAQQLLAAGNAEALRGRSNAAAACGQRGAGQVSVAFGSASVSCCVCCGPSGGD